MLSQNIQRNISLTPRDIMLQCLHAKLYVSHCFLYPSFVSIFTHYAPPFEVFSLSIVQHVFYRSLVGKWMRLSVPTFIQSHAYIRGNQTACLLVPDWLWKINFFCFFSPLHTQFSSFQNIQPLCCVVRALLVRLYISCIELIFIIFYVSVWITVDEIK